jgi:hypothetical protein
MGLLNTGSLAKTVDSINEVFFLQKKIGSEEKRKTAEWIGARQGGKLSYAKMFSPTEFDMRHGMRVFTGERITSGAALRHVLGEETCRAMLELKVRSTTAREALARAEKGMVKRLQQSKDWFYKSGIYCCGTCTVSLWRNLLAGGLNDRKRRISVGMKALKKYRDGTGRWRRFPFYYTLLALSEIDTLAAKKEKQYVAPILEKLLKRKMKQTKYNGRRRIVAERILSQI